MALRGSPPPFPPPVGLEPRGLGVVGAKPKVKDAQDAIMGEWLRLSMYVKATDFRARLQTHRRECLVYHWDNLSAVWERYACEARRAWKHFKARPRVYGESTPEMIERFKVLEKEHGAVAARWRAFADWARTAPELPAEVLAYDPTGKTSDLDADEPDRWNAVRGADLAERLAERNRLRRGR